MSIISPSVLDREVSPKLVVGAKKYGRRSKPENNEKELEESSTQAVDNEEHMENEENVGAVTHSEGKLIAYFIMRGRYYFKREPNEK